MKTKEKSQMGDGVLGKYREHPETAAALRVAFDVLGKKKKKKKRLNRV